MSMLDHVFIRDVQLYKMVANNPNIRKSIMNFVQRIINMIHSERFDPTTVKFEAMVPAGEPNKILVMLKAAEYTTKPLIEAEVLPNDPNYQLVAFTGSLYKALMENNTEIQSFMHACPELSSFVFVVSLRILEYAYMWRREDFPQPMDWDIYDHWETKDLFIGSYIPYSPDGGRS